LATKPLNIQQWHVWKSSTVLQGAQNWFGLNWFRDGVISLCFCKHSDISAIARNPEPLLNCLININHIEMSGIAEFVADRKVIPKLNLNIQYSCTENETIMTVDHYVTTVSEQLLVDSVLNRTLNEEILWNAGRSTMVLRPTTWNKTGTFNTASNLLLSTF